MSFFRLNSTFPGLLDFRNEKLGFIVPDIPTSTKKAFRMEKVDLE